jgi:hypothetical protein
MEVIMNIKMNAFQCFQKRLTLPSRSSPRKEALIFSIALPALLFALSSFGGAHGGAPGGGGAPRGGMAPRPALSPARPALTPTGPAIMERPVHGTIRHLDTHAVQRPFEVRPQPQRPIESGREFAPRRDAFVHRDVDVDIHRHRGGDDFHFHRHFRVLPFGFVALAVGGLPFYYADGIYYQPADDGGYQEVYPPVGATIPGLPDGAIAIDANGTTYYYAGGAFYVQQSDGTYAITPAPMGVIVPELPPGAVPANISGQTAYQFNGVFYEPVFVNGVTQYQTFVPTG